GARQLGFLFLRQGLQVARQGRQLERARLDEPVELAVVGGGGSLLLLLLRYLGHRPVMVLASRGSPERVALRRQPRPVTRNPSSSWQECRVGVPSAPEATVSGPVGLGRDTPSDDSYKTGSPKTKSPALRRGSR